MSEPGVQPRPRSSLSVLIAAYEKTRRFFPPLHDHAENRGDSDDVGPVLRAHGAFFEKTRAGPVFTSVHAIHKTDAQKESSREAAAAMVARTGACGNAACASRTSGVPRPQLKLCGRCHLVGYCGVDCQRAHWAAHKDFCKDNALANPSSEPVVVDEAVGAFQQIATAAVNNASGPIAMLAHIWRQRSGYAGGSADAAANHRGGSPLPPVVLLEIDDAARAPPAALRISALPLFDIILSDDGAAHPEKRFVDDVMLGPLLLMSLRSDATPGPELRSGARVMVVVTTPARDPRRTKIMTLTHGVPLETLAKTFRTLERAAVDESGGDSDDSEDSTAYQQQTAVMLLAATQIIARPLDDAEAAVLPMDDGNEESTDERLLVAGTFGNFVDALGVARLAPGEHGLRRVVAIIVGEVEMTFRGEPISTR
jgi:hypothetical protein